jgi:hypothetical protein
MPERIGETFDDCVFKNDERSFLYVTLLLILTFIFSFVSGNIVILGF